MIANTPKPPYYAVIFTSIRTEGEKDYNNMSDKMVELAEQQEGFLGIESARNELGITVSYWNNLEAIQHWKLNVDHTEAREKGRSTWYKQFKVRICKVERDYGFGL
ncbi:antibiotic biosynthesis monooxygenase [uncultured Lutibacter sp.]|uniref:antibiotic biosynthesis monooxygenase family protein n=1 Tax=uncultured Lutibacter sp. TaxID=437739 RepID=UPI00260EAA6C|nr:antibiotic biosynthesis monooxygenase [uncultured Lutibacter sp.]